MDVKERGAKVYMKVDDDAELHDDRDIMTASNQTPRVEFYEPDSDDEDQNKEKGTCADNCFCVKCLFMVGSVAIGTLSIIFDWLWVADMFKAEKALVFGPASSGVNVALIIMATFGTITYILENGDKIYNFVTQKEVFDEQAEETMSLFFEEVPQMTLNLMLSMCREIPMSYFQLFKAALGMASTGLRLLKGFCYISGCRTPKKNRRRLRLFGRLLLMVACMYTFAAGIAVFVFMYKEPENSGNLDGRFYAPANVFGDAYNTERYFPNSGVFFRHPSFDHCNMQGGSTGGNNWLRIEVIYSFLLMKISTIETVYRYNKENAMLGVRSLRRQFCYRIYLPNCFITQAEMPDCAMDSLDMPSDISMDSPTSTGVTTSLYLVFHHTPISKTHVFGDIKYNATITTNGQCRFMDGDKYGNIFSNSSTEGQIQYFKAPYTVNTTLPFRMTNEYNFYQYPADLNNVTDAWRTGYKDCVMSGALAPNIKPLDTSCVNWNNTKP